MKTAAEINSDLAALKAAATKEWGYKGHWVAHADKYVWTYADVASVSLLLTARFSVKDYPTVREWSVTLNQKDGVLNSCLDLDTLFHNLKIIVINQLRNKLGVDLEDL